MKMFVKIRPKGLDDEFRKVLNSDEWYGVSEMAGKNIVILKDGTLYPIPLHNITETDMKKEVFIVLDGGNVISAMGDHNIMVTILDGDNAEADGEDAVKALEEKTDKVAKLVDEKVFEEYVLGEPL